MLNSNIPEWARKPGPDANEVQLSIVDLMALWLKAPVATTPWVNDLIRQAHDYHEKRTNVVAASSRVSNARPSSNLG